MNNSFYIIKRTNAVGYVRSLCHSYSGEDKFTTDLNDARRFNDINELLEFASRDSDAVNTYYVTIARVQSVMVESLKVTNLESDILL
jgi:hypothetical protein